MAFEEEEHEKRVQRISEKVREAREKGEKPRIYHGSSHSVRPEELQSDEKIHINRLNNFIEIDKEEKTVLMEPVIEMRDLLEKTLEHGLIPHVVPEFPAITVGGAIQGGAGESSCFKHGLFGKNCPEYEIVTGEGEVLTASSEENKDLFHGTLGSYGSLGILTGVKMKLKDAEEFVKLEYTRVNRFEEAIEKLKEKSRKDYDYVDGIMFSRNRGVIMTGELSEKKDLPVKKFTRARDEWFYIHADKISREKQEHEELVPIKDYFFRYDIGSFWASKYGFKDLKMPFNRVTRTIYHPFLDTETAYDAGIHGGNFSSEYIIQDIITPQENTTELLEWSHENLGIYPLWLLPMEPERESELAPSYLDTELAINVGIWGRPSKGENYRELKEKLEEKQMEIDARKTLYAQQFYSEKDFWSIYDRKQYTSLRGKYNATEVFPDIYSTTHVDRLPEPSIFKAGTSMLKSKISQLI